MFDQFVEYLYALGLAPTTITVYVRCVERWQAWMVDNQIAVASALVLAEYAQDIPQTAASRRQHRVALRHWFDATGVDSKMVAAIRVPQKRRGMCRALEPDEATRLVNAAAGVHPAGTAVLLGMYLGLRREEIATARWDRFTPDGSWYRVLGKRDIEAELPVHPYLWSQLEGRMSVYPWLFPGRSSGHVNAGTVSAWCAHVAEQAGLGAVAPHRLRHTAIATINDETGDLRAAQEFARHADPSTTRIYTRVTAQRLRRAVDSLRYIA